MARSSHLQLVQLVLAAAVCVTALDINFCTEKPDLSQHIHLVHRNGIIAYEADEDEDDGPAYEFDEGVVILDEATEAAGWSAGSVAGGAAGNVERDRVVLTQTEGGSLILRVQDRATSTASSTAQLGSAELQAGTGQWVQCGNQVSSVRQDSLTTLAVAKGSHFVLWIERPGTATDADFSDAELVVGFNSEPGDACSVSEVTRLPYNRLSHVAIGCTEIFFAFTHSGVVNSFQVQKQEFFAAPDGTSFSLTGSISTVGQASSAAHAVDFTLDPSGERWYLLMANGEIWFGSTASNLDSKLVPVTDAVIQRFGGDSQGFVAVLALTAPPELLPLWMIIVGGAVLGAGIFGIALLVRKTSRKQHEHKMTVLYESYRSQREAADKDAASAGEGEDAGKAAADDPAAA